MKNEDPIVETRHKTTIGDGSSVGAREKSMIEDVLDFFRFGNTLNGNSGGDDELTTSSILKGKKKRRYGKETRSYS